MPGSLREGRAWAMSVIRDLDPKRILDVGTGRGAYRAWYEVPSDWTALEIWGPYVREFKLDELYDHVVIADCRWVDWGRLGDFDLVIFGDVLEHMLMDEARDVFARASAHATHILVSLPIVEYEQHELNGNTFEAHVETWSVDDARSLGTVENFWIGPQIGRFLFCGTGPSVRLTGLKVHF